MDRRVGGCAERLKDEQHLILLDETAGLLHSLWWRVSVVKRDEIDLASVDSTFNIDFPEVGIDGLADRAIR